MIKSRDVLKCQIFSLIIKLVYITISFRRLDDIQKLGMHLDYFILTNLYSAVFAFCVRIYNRTIK